MSTGRKRRPSQFRCLPATSGRDPAPARRSPCHRREFQSDAVELEERVPPRIARLTLYGVTGSHRLGHRLGVAVFDRRGRHRPRQADHDQADHHRAAAGNLDHSIDRCPCRRRGARRPDACDTRRDFQPVRRRAATGQICSARRAGEAASKPNSRRRLLGDRRQIVGRTVAGAAVRTAARLLCRPDAEFRPADRRPGRDDRSSKDQEKILVSRRDNLAQIEEAREILYKNETGSLLNLLGSRDARLEVDDEPGAIARQGRRSRTCAGQAHGRPAGVYRGFSPRD